MSKERGSVRLDDEGLEVLALAELEARRAGGEAVDVRHIALALAGHPRWKGPFDEMGLSYKGLRGLLLEKTEARGGGLELAEAAAGVVERAGALCGSGGRGVCGGHLLRAILEGGGPVAKTIEKESGVPLAELLGKPELLALPAARQRGVPGRAAEGLRRLGRWTVAAFAWSALWATLLYIAARWCCGGAFAGRWFLPVVVGVGLACMAGWGAWRVVQAVRSRRAAR
jgi:hypothetical protein